MNERSVLTDAAIRSALTPPQTVRAPMDLAIAIRSAIDVTPQQRRPFLTRLVPQARGPIRLVALAVVVAVLILIALLFAVGRQQPVLEGGIVDEAMFRGGPARTGVVVGPGPTNSHHIAWDQKIGGPVIANMPAIVAGVVYVADGIGGVTSFAALDGRHLWTHEIGSPANTSPAVGGGFVVVGDEAGDVVALDVATGDQKWTQPTGGSIRSSPAIVDGIVFVGSEDGFLYAFDLADGHPRWKFDASGPITRSPAVEHGVVFTGAGGGLFSAVDAANGSQKWQAHLGPGQIATPAVRDGVVLATSGIDQATAPHVLFGLDAATGQVLWRWPSPSDAAVYVGSFDDGLVITTSADGNVSALAVAAGSVDPTPRWSFLTHAPIGNAAAIAGGVLYVAGGDRTIYAIDEATGQALWSQPVTGQPGAVGVVGNRLYVATDLGRVIAIGGTP